MSAFFVSISFHAEAFAPENCNPIANSPTEKATVKWVYDGDTLLLSDERKIRIIGIDTPETRHHKQKAEAYGAEARESLRALLKKSDYKVTLNYETERKDKYARTLAHVFTPDGTNISSWLLTQGYARTLVIPPNLKHAECYKQAEIQAQKQQLKIWQLKNHQLQSVDTLAHKSKGFVRLKGKITSVKTKNKSLIIELESNSRRPIQIEVKQRNRPYFKAINFKKLISKNIIVTGMLKNKHGRRLIRINHPSQIEILAPKLSTRENVPTIKWSLQQ